MAWPTASLLSAPLGHRGEGRRLTLGRVGVDVGSLGSGHDDAPFGWMVIVYASLLPHSLAIYSLALAMAE